MHEVLSARGYTNVLEFPIVPQPVPQQENDKYNLLA